MFWKRNLVKRRHECACSVSNQWESQTSSLYPTLLLFVLAFEFMCVFVSVFIFVFVFVFVFLHVCPIFALPHCSIICAQPDIDWLFYCNFLYKAVFKPSSSIMLYCEPWFLPHWQFLPRRLWGGINSWFKPFWLKSLMIIISWLNQHHRTEYTHPFLTHVHT